jgi:hypothetical protein
MAGEIRHFANRKLIYLTLAMADWPGYKIGVEGRVSVTHIGIGPRRLEAPPLALFNGRMGS